VLLGVGDVAPHYQLVVERPGAMDQLTVLCEPAADVAEEGLQARIERALQEATGLSIQVLLMATGGVPRSEGKAVRVVDRRSA
jgi:phenylacetate-CoA ligase